METEIRYAKGKGINDVTDLFVYLCEEVLNERWVDIKRKYLRGMNTRTKTVTFRELALVLEKTGVEFELSIIHRVEPTLKDIRAERLERLRAEREDELIDDRHTKMEEQAQDIKTNKDLIPKIPGEVNFDQWNETKFKLNLNTLPKGPDIPA